MDFLTRSKQTMRKMTIITIHNDRQDSRDRQGATLYKHMKQFLAPAEKEDVQILAEDDGRNYVLM